MLYEAYQVHHDVLGPVRLMAEALRGLLDQPWPLIGNAPMIRSAAAAMELLSNAGMWHNRPDFDIGSVVVDGRAEELHHDHPAGHDHESEHEER